MTIEFEDVSIALFGDDLPSYRTGSFEGEASFDIDGCVTEVTLTLRRWNRTTFRHETVIHTVPADHALFGALRSAIESQCWERISDTISNHDDDMAAANGDVKADVA